MVLCPSIALVAQLRREFLQHTTLGIRALAVCSDRTAGYDPSQEGNQQRALDPTRDNSQVSASEVKGQVTTDPDTIAGWISAATDDRISVMFGTYQSAGRIAEALQTVGATIDVLVCDEAHRTASLRRKKPVAEQARLREFTLCHNQDAFPARYRVYQTATPRIYNLTRGSLRAKARDYVVRSMDDETVFGVELYRRSYVDAVRNGWLADYRIIALGMNDPETYRTANQLARRTETKGRGKLTTVDYLRGLALAMVMGGGTRNSPNNDDEGVSVQSCIAFMNTVAKSMNMAKDLQTDTVAGWLRKQMGNGTPVGFTLEHLDATDNVARRDNAKRRLADASPTKPHGVINVGIFGEGTDSPSLSAVAFLEPRKSPIDVVQAVGRAMRTAPGKQFGYIICPIHIPINADPERWLTTSKPEEGWAELGQILLALRAHDSRIEENLADLLQVYTPPQLIEVRETTLVGVASASTKRVRNGVHIGPPGTAEDTVEEAAKSDSPLSQHGIGPVRPQDWTADTEPTRILTAKPNSDGTVDLRTDTVVRDKPKAGEPRGRVNADRSKKHAKKMINNDEGLPVPPKKKRRKPAKTKQERQEEHAQRMLKLVGETFGESIWVNLLTRSGLRRDRINRDLNILRESIREASHHLRGDRLEQALDHHFGLDRLAANKRDRQADGCTIAALLLMNAAMLHQRVVEGGWMRSIKPLSDIKASAKVIAHLEQNWERITRQDFLPVITPAREAIYAIKNTGKLAGLERALHHIAAEAERIAAMYADMGADHAGPLFNKVMGNQASDGAYFTRPPAATVAARLTLDALGSDLDWANPDTWRQHKTVDLACGSGTLLAAMLADMKRRAKEQGATRTTVARLQKVAVEEQLKGMDINPVSLQLAATQLTAGNADIKYRRMGLYQMPYGPTGDPLVPTGVGTLELFAEDRVVPLAQTKLFAQAAAGRAIRLSLGDPVVEDAAADAMDARVVIMNPPFTNRQRMGEKFPVPTQKLLRARVDSLEQTLVGIDPHLDGFWDKNTLAPLFVALADRCVDTRNGVLTLIHPTIALTNPSGERERCLLAKRYHVHTIVTCHQPGNINLSQQTNINESILVLKRDQGPRPPTRIINLDRFPKDDTQAEDLFQSLPNRPGEVGVLSGGWGEVSAWPAERIRQGDWTAAIWRSPDLAEASHRYAQHPQLTTITEAGLSPHATGRQLRGSYRPATAGHPHAFPILKSKGANAQQRIESTPDEHWEWKQPGQPPILEKAAFLLITAGQDTSTGRLTAVASDRKYVGNGWMPITSANRQEAQALAVFINSTVGRLLLMRNPGKKLAFPTYSRAEAANLPIPDLSHRRSRGILADCWEQTRHMTVPQYRDGETPVRRQWDTAVCNALGWNEDKISHLRKLLHEEPHVRGLGYGQYQDEHPFH